MRRLVDEVAEVAAIAPAKVRDEHVEELVRTALVPRFREEPISPLLGGLLQEVVADDLHHGLVDLALEELHRWLALNRDGLHRDAVGAGPVVGAAAGERGRHPAHPHRGVRWIEDIRNDPTTTPGPRWTPCSPSSPTTCSSTPRPRRADRGAQGADARPPGGADVVGVAVERAAARRWSRSLRDPAGAVRARLQTEVSAFATRLLEDDDLRRRMDLVAADVAVFTVERYGTELTTVITHTIERWDGKEAARRIELHVGPGPAVHPDQRHHRRRPGGRAIHSFTVLLVIVDVPPVRCHARSIRLGQFLKLANLIDSGSDAKPLLAAGEVLVNGEVETRRGRSSSWATWSRRRGERPCRRRRVGSRVIRR